MHKKTGKLLALMLLIMAMGSGNLITALILLVIAVPVAILTGMIEVIEIEDREEKAK